MKLATSIALSLFWSLQLTSVAAFVPQQQQQRVRSVAVSPSSAAPVAVTSLFSSLKEKEDTETAATDASPTPTDPDAEGLPWWWELVWKLDIMQKGVPGEEIIFGDSANVLRTNIEQIYGGYPSLDGCPLAEGELDDIASGTMFVGLQSYEKNYGSPYKLCFGT